MSDTSQGQGSGQGTQQEQGTGTGEAGGQQQGGASGTEEGEPFDQERALRTIRNQRESEKRLTAELAEAKKALKAQNDSTLSETQKLQQQVEELTKKLDEKDRKAARSAFRDLVSDTAKDLGFKNPALAHRLIDEADVEYDDDKPVNIKRLLKGILKDEPYLAGANGNGDGGAGQAKGQRPGQKTDMNAILRQSAGFQ